MGQGRLRHHGRACAEYTRIGPSIYYSWTSCRSLSTWSGPRVRFLWGEGRGGEGVHCARRASSLCSPPLLLPVRPISMMCLLSGQALVMCRGVVAAHPAAGRSRDESLERARDLCLEADSHYPHA